MNGHTDTYGMPAQNGQYGMQELHVLLRQIIWADMGQDKKSTV